MNLLTLPDEILLKILSFLPCRCINTTIFVCKKLMNIALDDQLWRYKYEETIHETEFFTKVENDLQFTNSKSWKELVNQWLNSPPFIYKTLQTENIYLEAQLGDVEHSFFPLDIPGNDFLTFECIFEQEYNDINEKKEKLKPILQQFIENPVLSKNDFSFRIRNTNVFYYEIFTMPNEKKSVYYVLEEAIGIGFSCLRLNIRDRAFPGWDIGTVGYHSDDGKLFISVS